MWASKAVHKHFDDSGSRILKDGWMTIRVLALVVVSALCSSGIAQAAGTPSNAKQLVDWRKAGGAKLRQYQQFVNVSYEKLVDAREICPPAARSKQASRDAAFLAIQSGIDDGLFNQDVSAADAVRDVLGFWFPCSPR
ncbi:hypothetical protein M2282_006119 [Variovorax boronicumulans]|uniref:hypothetical protein n=1 Tax=Variovorax boronicumulans TaxID=436515 RepID=UPI002475415D|nr:hypothetical protein [Variovorax boronicumulans]MDH6170939.1 hypothetical protein [Variovorax boronicumulans]